MPQKINSDVNVCVFLFQPFDCPRHEMKSPIIQNYSKLYTKLTLLFACYSHNFLSFKASSWRACLFSISNFEAIWKRLALKNGGQKGCWGRWVNRVVCVDGEAGQHNARLPGAAVEQRAEPQHVPEQTPLLAAGRVPHPKNILLRALVHQLLK